MKKIFCSLLLIILMVGVSGCMEQPNEDEKKASESEMLSYLKNEYGGEFKRIEYIAGERGYNDSHNENILVAESENGILVNVREELGDKGNYYDDYENAYASKLINEKVDYSVVKNIRFTKTYVTLNPEKVNIEDLRKDDFSLESDMVINLFSLISISAESDEEILKDLYEVYEQVQSLGYNRNNFVVAFEGNSKKAEKYVNNYFLYGTQAWEKYDESNKEILRVTQNGLSFEQFRNQIISIGG